MLSNQRAGGGQIGFEKFYPLSDEKTPFRAFIAEATLQLYCGALAHSKLRKTLPL